jgi:rod shape-determining protein MreB
MNALAELRKFVVPPDLAIDLGSSQTRLFAQRHGLLADEPTLVQRENGVISATGLAAARASGWQSLSNGVVPVQAGKVTDSAAVAWLLKSLLHDNASGLWMLGSRFIRALVCVSQNLQPQEQEVLFNALRQAGIAAATAVSKTLAAAIGAGVDVASPYAQLLVDIGAQTTEIAALRAGSVVYAKTLPMGCQTLHQAVQQHVKAPSGIQLALREADLLTRAVGLECACAEERTFLARGENAQNQQLESFCVSSDELSEILQAASYRLLLAIHTTIQQIEPVLACEAIESGLMLTGGGALLSGLPERLARLTGFSVKVAAHPLHATILGAGEMLQVSAATKLWAKKKVSAHAFTG